MREGQKTFTARHLRKDETLAEKRLWEHLRNRTVHGCKFVRQSPAGPYIADFLCRTHKLIIEVDGATHSTTAEIDRDRVRTAYLEAQGFRVLRFHNDEIINGLDEVLTIIRSALSCGPSSPPLLRNGSPSSPVAREKTRTRPLPLAGEEGAPSPFDGGGEGTLKRDIPPTNLPSPAPSSPPSGRRLKEDNA